MTNKVIDRNIDAIIKAAAELNFYGKRIRESKLTVCDAILLKIDVAQSQLESGVLCDWLEENKDTVIPPKPKAVRVSNKLDADTMGGTQSQKRSEFENLGDGTFLVTAAQNNTQAHNVIGQLEALAEQLGGAKIVVMPMYYNKAAYKATHGEEAKEAEENLYFDDLVKPYLIESDKWLGGVDGVRLAVSAHVSPTAKQPVNAAVTINANEAVTIVASPRQDMQQIAVMQDRNKRQAWTTGAATVYNYLEKRAGAEAETAHKFGALIVRVKDRQVTVENVYQGQDGTLTTWQECASECLDVDVVLGDSHFERFDENVTSATINWLQSQSVRSLAVHDILHFETRSHHNRVSGNHLYKMQMLGKTVLQDLTTVITQTNRLADTCQDLYIVESNHNSALDNWLDDMKYQPKTDPQNAKLYYLINWAVCESIDNGFDRNALQVAMEDCTERASLPFLAENARFGAMDKSEEWQGVEVSQHGHKGQNGSSGSTQLFGKSGMTIVTGHTHTPAIRGNAFTVGVSASLQQGYNKGGLSSWNHANAVILPNGTVQLITTFPINF